MEKLITRKEAAKLLGISLTTLDEARNSGLISYVQYVPNGCVYFTDASLQEYIPKRKTPIEMCESKNNHPFAHLLNRANSDKTVITALISFLWR